MSIEESKKIIQRIKVFRPFFHTGNSSKEQFEFLSTWHEILEPYDYDDVLKKIDEYFKDGDNIGKIPDAYYLTKFLRTHEEKKKEGGDVSIQCHLCKKWMTLYAFENHFDRCSSVTTINGLMKKYYDREVDSETLLKMDETEFESKYLAFIEKAKSKITSVEEKNRLIAIEKALKNENINFKMNELM